MNAEERRESQVRKTEIGALGAKTLSWLLD